MTVIVVLFLVDRINAIKFTDLNDSVLVKSVSGEKMFCNQPDYKKMEYTSNRLRKEFVSMGRIKRWSDRKSPYLKNLTPWELLSESEKDECSWESIKVERRISSTKTSRQF